MRRWLWLALAGSLAATVLVGYGPELVGPVEPPVVKQAPVVLRKGPGQSEGGGDLLDRQGPVKAETPSPRPGAAPAVSGKESQPPVESGNETVAAARAETPDQGQETAPPSVLGAVTLEENELLSWLMIKFYGRFSPGLLDRVARANPQIRDLNDIAVGDVIRLPALAALHGRRSRSGCWIEVAHTRELSRAMEFLRHYPREAPAARVVPYWLPDDGLHFSVLLWPCFSDDGAAMGQKAALPAVLAPGSRLIRQWDDRAVFFSDPYRVR